MMFYDGRSFNDHWDRVYGNWGWHFAMMDKIENLTVRIRQYDIQKLHQRWYLWSQIDRGVPRPAYYGEASWKVLRVRMYFPDHMEEMDFKSRSDLELTKFLLERDVVLYYNGADYYFKKFMGGDSYHQEVGVQIPLVMPGERVQEQDGKVSARVQEPRKIIFDWGGL
jgi:hypothetical protein